MDIVPQVWVYSSLVVIRTFREERMMKKASKLSWPGSVKQKEFKPQNNLPRLENYTVDPPQSYWDKWNKLSFSEASYSS